MVLVLSETPDSWPIAWFLRTSPSRPEGGLALGLLLWLCVPRGMWAAYRGGEHFCESELVRFRSLVQPCLQSSNYLDHMEPPFSPRLPADTWSIATAQGPSDQSRRESSPRFIESSLGN